MDWLLIGDKILEIVFYAAVILYIVKKWNQ